MKNEEHGDNKSGPRNTCGGSTKENRTIGFPTTLSPRDKLARVHPKALLKTTADPTYMSAGYQEFRITQSGPYWVVKQYMGGRIAKELQGFFQTFHLAEETLIKYLRRTNRWNKAIWPGQ